MTRKEPSLLRRLVAFMARVVVVVFATATAATAVDAQTFGGDDSQNGLLEREYQQTPTSRDHQLSHLEALNSRIDSLRLSLPAALDRAANAISENNARSNIRALSYGAGVFAGTILSIASLYEGLTDEQKENPPASFIFTKVSFALNGWSFGGIWIAEGQLDDPVVKCGGGDFEEALAQHSQFYQSNREYAESNLISLVEGENPFDVVQKHDLSEAVRSSFPRFEEDLRSSLDCVLSQSGASAEALEAEHMLSAFLGAHAARIDVLEALREQAFEQHLSGLDAGHHGF